MIKYLRFRDDVLCLVKDPQSSKLTREMLIELSSPFCQIKLESYSLVACTFLDFKVFKSDPEGQGVLKFMPHIKPTARHVPLASDSHHPWGVRKAWPCAEVLRTSRRASDTRMAKDWQVAKINRFVHFLINARIIKLCKGWNPCVPSVAAGL